MRGLQLGEGFPVLSNGVVLSLEYLQTSSDLVHGKEWSTHSDESRATQTTRSKAQPNDENLAFRLNIKAEVTYDLGWKDWHKGGCSW